MDFCEYQRLASRTAADSGDKQKDMLVLALGVCGEAGEAAELIKKHVGHGHPLVRAELEKELGDVLWYIAALASANNISLEEMAKKNIEKLEKRYPNGFSSASSMSRQDEPVTICEPRGPSPGRLKKEIPPGAVVLLKSGLGFGELGWYEVVKHNNETGWIVVKSSSCSQIAFYDSRVVEVAYGRQKPE